MKTCTVTEGAGRKKVSCDGAHIAHGYCSKHLQRFYRNGSVGPVGRRERITDRARPLRDKPKALLVLIVKRYQHRSFTVIGTGSGEVSIGPITIGRPSLQSLVTRGYVYKTRSANTYKVSKKGSIFVFSERLLSSHQISTAKKAT